ncbi:TetR/AcrR family transcriptional regulator [Companilactobacillus insicii]|uniref:TetR/AcrR family transcriptional regulator n=1 Tax=Companilactobacillus insicii TaxID=1732567 RepID=UPI000F7B6277|nr:TetR/AcrR family transcriptional regulator [Companilactobacillus insicii]
MENKEQRLFDSAHELFLKQGFKETNIASIAQHAGVAVGTFYRYFDSKEDIFVKIYNIENENVKRKILSEVDMDQLPNKLISEILQKILLYTNDNHILKEWFNNSKINSILVKENSNAIENSVIYATLNKLIDKWMDKGLLRDGFDKKRIISMFNALAILDIHQSEIVTDDYFQLLNDLISGILKVCLK